MRSKKLVLAGKGLWLTGVAVPLAIGALALSLTVVAILVSKWFDAAAWGLITALSLRLAWRGISYTRSPLSTARRDFIAAALTLIPGDTYLARDAHRIFSRHRLAWWLPVLCLSRRDEDEFEQVIREGSAIVGTTEYRIIPGYAPVIARSDADSIALAGSEVIFKEPPRRSRRAALAGLARTFRLPPSSLYASPEELREVTAQIRAAERLGPPKDRDA